MRNFRNFLHQEISFGEGKNIIIGNNGRGKSNILEALSLPSSPMVESHPKYLLNKESDVFFIEYSSDIGKLSYSYSNDGAKRKYMLEGKPTTKTKFRDAYPAVVSFHPMIMNLLYLGPSHRRDFLDGVLSQSFSPYSQILTNYKKILSSRNRVLKNISQGKSDVSELSFWNEKYITLAVEIYEYRAQISSFLKANIGNLEEYFFGKINKIQFEYISKTSMQDTKSYLQTYIQENVEKEILLRKTLRGPHLDDFDIYIDDIPLTHFASRGEVKSILLGLKMLETQFIEKTNNKKILFLIDDLLSELDEKHRDLLWQHIGNRQSIISSISDFPVEGNKIYI